jgi:hypothetical protein
MNRTPSLRIVLALAALAAALCIPPLAANAAATCHQLNVTKHVKKQLRAAHARITNRPFTGPHKRVYYGHCGPTAYALASFKDNKVGFGDQPERFKRREGHGWKDRGDTGGDVCGAAPRVLLREWGFTNC